MKAKHLKALNRRAEWLKTRVKEEDGDYDKAELSALLAVLRYFEYDTVYAIIEEEGVQDE